MEFFKIYIYFLHFVMVIFPSFCNSEGVIAKNITVALRGQGDFTSVQKAIDSIPSNNTLWTLVHVKAGIYNEKVIIPEDKPFIILEGEISRRETVIQWADFGSSTQSSTIIIHAHNFVAKNIAFKNTYNLGIPNKNPIKWAPAATIHGDKASFYGCGFHGVMDTLTDAYGRHYFRECYIEGAIDFIWGKACSFYQKCVINATTGILNGKAGYITAQGKDGAEETNGFVFADSSIHGTGPVYLGRAYGNYSTVVFKGTFMDAFVMPQGWFAWNYAGQEDKFTYSEVLCMGPGSNKSRRVKWEKNLTPHELSKFIDVHKFINQDGWIQAQPILQ